MKNKNYKYKLNNLQPRSNENRFNLLLDFKASSSEIERDTYRTVMRYFTNTQYLTGLLSPQNLNFVTSKIDKDYVFNFLIKERNYCLNSELGVSPLPYFLNCVNLSNSHKERLMSNVLLELNKKNNQMFLKKPEILADFLNSIIINNYGANFKEISPFFIKLIKDYSLPTNIKLELFLETVNCNNFELFKTFIDEGIIPLKNPKVLNAALSDSFHASSGMPTDECHIQNYLLNN